MQLHHKLPCLIFSSIDFTLVSQLLSYPISHETVEHQRKQNFSLCYSFLICGVHVYHLVIDWNILLPHPGLAHRLIRTMPT